jgi:nitrite reductase (NADH) small subunit
MNERNGTGGKQWVRITECANIPVREGRTIMVGNHSIAVFNLGQRFAAIENRCPHRGGPLAEGIVCGATVVCPLHGWKIDLETGVAASASPDAPCVQTYRTRIEGGILEIEIPVAGAPRVETCETTRVHRDRPIRWVQRKLLTTRAEMRELP